MNANWYDVLQQVEQVGGIPRILLWGPPGTGKTTAACNICGRNGYYRVCITRGITSDDLIGGWRLDHGSTVWVPGPVVLAMREGRTLVLDEIDRVSAEVESLLHVILDDPSLIQVTTPSGVVTPATGYRVVGTTNARPDELPEAVLDRFLGGLILYADTPAPGALRALTTTLAEYIAKTYQRVERQHWTAPVSYRAVSGLQSLVRAGLTLDDAAALIWGEEGQAVADAIRACEVGNEETQ